MNSSPVAERTFSVNKVYPSCSWLSETGGGGGRGNVGGEGGEGEEGKAGCSLLITRPPHPFLCVSVVLYGTSRRQGSSLITCLLDDNEQGVL